MCDSECLLGTRVCSFVGVDYSCNIRVTDSGSGNTVAAVELKNLLRCLCSKNLVNAHGRGRLLRDCGRLVDKLGELLQLGVRGHS